MGADFENVEIKNDKIQRSEGIKTTINSHYGLKFRNADIEKLEIEMELPRPDESEIFVIIATDNDSKGMDELDRDKFETNKRVDLTDGINKLDTDIEWKKFAFLKIVLHVYKENVESPKIKNIKLKGTQTKQVREKEEESGMEARKPDIPTEKEEEMPAFEDVEYKDLECPECGEHFKTDIGLRVHRKVNHPEEFKKNPEV